MAGTAYAAATGGYRPARWNAWALALTIGLQLGVAALLVCLAPAPADMKVAARSLAIFSVELDAPPPPPPPPPPAAPARPDDAPVTPRAVVAPLPQVPSPLPAAVIAVSTAAVAADAPPAPPVPAAAPAPPAPPAVTAGDLSSTMIDATPPRYPRESRRRREQGVVVLMVRLSADGRVATISIARSSGHSRLDDAARDAVRRWRWSPRIVNGTAVEVQGTIEIPFVLTRDPR